MVFRNSGAGQILAVNFEGFGYAVDDLAFGYAVQLVAAERTFCHKGLLGGFALCPAPLQSW